MEDVLWDLFRSLMFFIDDIVYGLIPTIYKLFIYLSELNLYGDNSSDPLHALVNHVYVLLGIFMLFKVSFSLLQYLVSPDDFKDSSKGMGKLVTNVLVALVLLVSVPTIFEVATTLQNAIVRNNVIGQIILGTNMSSVDENNKIDGIDAEKVNEMAKDLQFMLFGAFYNLNPTVTASGKDYAACEGTSGVFGSVDVAKAEDCLNAIQENLPDDATAAGVSLYSFFKYKSSNSAISGEACSSDGVCDDRNFTHLGKLLAARSDDEYVINYMPFISTLAGGYVVFLLISFCIDVATRAIKLCVLQMVAPIAIVSYIDPQESLRDSKLRRWGHECFSTYVSLFLRLATIFLVMLLVSTFAERVLAGDIASQVADPDYNIWVYVFLIIGAFMFAKQLPKILDNIFKLSGNGDLNLNPFKTFAAARDSGFGSMAGLAVGTGLGAVTSGIAAGKTSLDAGESKGRALARTLGGTVSGAVRGGAKGISSGGKNVVSNSLNVAGDVSRNAAMKANTKFRYRVGSYVRNAMGAQSLKEVMDQDAMIYEGIENSVSAVKDRATSELAKKSDDWKIIQANRAKNEHDYKQGIIDKITYKNNLNSYHKNEEKLIGDYIDSNGKILGKEDYDLIKRREQLARQVAESKLGLKVDNYASMKDVKDVAHNKALDIKSSDKYEDATNAEKATLSDLRQNFLNKK